MGHPAASISHGRGKRARTVGAHEAGQAQPRPREPQGPRGTGKLAAQHSAWCGESARISSVRVGHGRSSGGQVDCTKGVRTRMRGSGGASRLRAGPHILERALRLGGPAHGQCRFVRPTTHKGARIRVHAYHTACSLLLHPHSHTKAGRAEFHTRRAAIAHGKQEDLNSGDPLESSAETSLAARVRSEDGLWARGCAYLLPADPGRSAMPRAAKGH